MFSREWKCICPKETENSFLEYLTITGIKDTQVIDGCEGYQVLRRELNDKTESIEITFISLWETLDSMKLYAGDNMYKAVLYPEDEKYQIESDTEVKVYEIMDT